MAENLTKAFQRFDLSNKEMEGIDLETDDVLAGIEECKLTLVGRIMGEKVANLTGVKNYTSHVWGYPRNLQVSELGPNVFQFNFAEEKDKEKALNRRPWVIDNQLLVVKPWSLGIERSTEAFHESHLWIQVWNLPIHWLSKVVGFKRGQMFSAVKEVIIPPGGGKEGRHMKILAEVDISQPLARGTTVKFNGNPIWVEFRYEKCPDFCYKCGIIGHGDKNFKTTVEKEYNQREEQFGAWMRAGNIMASPLRASRTVEGSILEKVEPQKQKRGGYKRK
ncbi:uncharacterized protein LOC113777103 [Coffea eugenioides]|uniref:uncharacterized protein LOC113777103 n=1 Tax=Coffea eugenioides TaxID=49369 RepID=UPI000F60759A|nr:uncharacterized protein LOC113777103 [Coffea eugenioides]